MSNQGLRMNVKAVSGVIAAVLFCLMIYALWAALVMGAAFSAKLSCSARYVTGLAPGHIATDVASYAGGTDIFHVDYHDDEQWVVASFADLVGHQRATYRHGLGCTLDYSPIVALDNYVPVPPLTTNALVSNPASLSAPTTSSNVR